VFRGSRGGRTDLFLKVINQPGEEETLWSDDLSKYPASWSQDGRFILYDTGISTPGTGHDVWVLLFNDRKPFPFVKTDFQERSPKFSPDGRWVAYQSNESGRYELYVVPFPGPGPRSRIAEGANIEWRHDGREVYYVKRGKMTALPVDGRGRTFEAGVEQPLFDMPVDMPEEVRGWDATADGRKFLIRVREAKEEEPSITLVVNRPMLLSKQR